MIESRRGVVYNTINEFAQIQVPHSQEYFMHYRRLGKSGLKVSEISLGAWVTFGDQITEHTARDLIHAAYEAGVNG